MGLGVASARHRPRHAWRGRTYAPWPTPLNLPEMIRHYESGVPLGAISKLWERSHMWAKELFARAGVKRRRPGNVPKEVAAAFTTPSKGPPPIFHHMRPARPTWPIGSLAFTAPGRTPGTVLCTSHQEARSLHSPSPDDSKT